MYWEQGRSSEATEAFGTAVDRAPSNKDFRIHLGNAYLKLGRDEEAEAEYRRALKATIRVKTESTYALQLGDLYRAQDSVVEAETNYLAAIAADPSDATPYGRLAELYRSQQRDDEAIELYKKAIGVGLPARFNSLQRYLALAEFHLEQGMPEKAEAVLNEAVHLNPFSRSLRLLLGEIYQAQGRMDEAVEEYQRLKRLEPGNLKGYLMVAAVYCEQERWAEAEAEYIEVLAIDQESSEAHRGLGFVFKVQGMWEKAISYYEKLTALDPERPLAHRLLGDAYFQQGRQAEAIAQYQKAVEIAPDDVQNLLIAGRALMKMGKANEAIEYYSEALKLSPDLVEIYVALGDANVSLNRYEIAEIAYRKALSIESTYFAAHLGLAHSYEAQGRIHEAIRVWDRLIAVEPDGVQAQRARARIRMIVTVDFLVRLKMKAATAPEKTEASVDVIKVQNEARNVILVPPSHWFSFRFIVPQGANLHFGIAVDAEKWKRTRPNERPTVFFKLRLGGEKLFSYRMRLAPESSASRWRDFDIDLSDFEGEWVRISFSTRIPSGMDGTDLRIGWSRPYITVNAQESIEQQ
jgi:tetratricopeptide (TPR) repeat protein